MQEAFGSGWLTGGKASLKLVNVLWVDESVHAYGQVREEVPEGARTRVHCDRMPRHGGASPRGSSAMKRVVSPMKRPASVLSSTGSASPAYSR